MAGEFNISAKAGYVFTRDTTGKCVADDCRMQYLSLWRTTASNRTASYETGGRYDCTNSRCYQPRYFRSGCLLSYKFKCFFAAFGVSFVFWVPSLPYHPRPITVNTLIMLNLTRYFSDSRRSFSSAILPGMRSMSWSTSLRYCWETAALVRPLAFGQKRALCSSEIRGWETVRRLGFFW